MFKQTVVRLSSQWPDGHLMYPSPLLQTWWQLAPGVWLLIRQEEIAK
jgi:hypothetical protein